MKLPSPGSRNSNESLASDLAAFVREKQIGGRGFMRMTEADLDGYVRVSFFFSVLNRSLVILIGVGLLSTFEQCPFFPLVRGHESKTPTEFLFRYGTPHIWHATFLSASRGLRQSTPHGRIFTTPLHNEPEDDDQDLNTMSEDQYNMLDAERLVWW